MNNNTNTRKQRIPALLLGKPRSKWSGVMVQKNDFELATSFVITLDDVMADLESRYSLGKAA
jgi:hypothetical protein